MKLLLTALSGLELLALLGFLVGALARIRREFEKIEDSLAHIDWGVRAIETQTAPLSQETQALLAGATQLAEGVETIADRLTTAANRLPNR